MNAFACELPVLVRRGAAVLALLAAFGFVAACQAASGHGDAEEAEFDEAGVRKNAIELGEFQIRSYYPVQARKSLVRFVLYATTDEAHFAETKRIVQRRQHKVREQVITVTRMTPLIDFDEPDLSRFRRRILMRLRHTVPELTIKDLYLSHFELKVKSL